MVKTDLIFDVVVIGGGIVGLASAYKIQKANPDLKVLVLEKEALLSDHQTGHNSGVIHSGLYYKPGSYKAKNCVEGRRELVQWAKDFDIAHDVCGKIVVATSDSELPYLDKIFQTGLQNKVEGIEKIGPEHIRDIESHCNGIAGIWVPCTGIIDFRGVTERMGELIPAINPTSEVRCNTEVYDVEKGEEYNIIFTNQGTIYGKHLVFCAGLQADRMAKMDNVNDIGMRVVGFRGDYYDLSERGMHKVKNLIYPVPNPAFPFLGVHFTRMIMGGVECGPNAVFVFKREAYDKTGFDWKDSWEALTYSGTWKLLSRNWQFAIDEYRRAFSKKLFLRQLQRLIPSLEPSDIEPGRCGVRAMALGPSGDMIDDFKIEYQQNSIHVLNAPSPAATSSLAIGTAVQKMADTHFGLK